MRALAEAAVILEELYAALPTGAEVSEWWNAAHARAVASGGSGELVRAARHAYERGLEAGWEPARAASHAAAVWDGLAPIEQVSSPRVLVERMVSLLDDLATLRSRASERAGLEVPDRRSARSAAELRHVLSLLDVAGLRGWLEKVRGFLDGEGELPSGYPMIEDAAVVEASPPPPAPASGLEGF